MKIPSVKSSLTRATAQQLSGVHKDCPHCLIKHEVKLGALTRGDYRCTSCRSLRNRERYVRVTQPVLAAAEPVKEAAPTIDVTYSNTVFGCWSTHLRTIQSYLASGDVTAACLLFKRLNSVACLTQLQQDVVRQLIDYGVVSVAVTAVPAVVEQDLIEALV